MNTVNASTGFSPFALKSGHSPWLIPPLIEALTSDPNPDTQPMTPEPTSNGEAAAHSLMEHLTTDLLKARDSLTAVKISQAHHVNKDWSPDHDFKVGDHILLAKAHCWRDYMKKKDSHIAKFMPRFDGPFKITTVFPEMSTYTLHLPDSSNIHRNFHSSLLWPCLENDDELFPSWALERPGPIVTENRETEYYINKIINKRTHGCGKQYLVRWLGYGTESDLWLPRRELTDTDTYAKWIAKHR